MMSSSNMVGLRSSNLGGVNSKAVKLESDLVGTSIAQMENFESDSVLYRKSSGSCGMPDSSTTGQSGTTVLDQDQSPIDDSSICSTSQICSAPLTRQFWKAGNYDEGLTAKSTIKKGSSFLHIHPKFLHSNATSHKWAFGALAELIDNAVDEIQNGATFVIVDTTLNPRTGCAALLIQDDGGGMDPEAIRRCMSFGFSDKKSTSAIGQYGNGFKTSSMRLGADVIVFSRSSKNRRLTQSIGLLSQTFLMQAGLDRIVVPLIDFEFSSATGKWNSLHSEQQSKSNLSLLLRWSPFATEAQLLKQFDDIGDHGTKVIVYNLWFNDEGKMELDFEADPEDIRLSGDANDREKSGSRVSASDLHLANRLRYSLRAYLSVLYLQIPDNFCILLRGRVVEYHNIAKDLKYPEFIVYKPLAAGYKEGSVLTSIGFVKEAPVVNVHGFNVYHKNRLILPFWHVVRFADSRGRGVVGVLEANFIQPTHNKQDFEKTPLFQKLEVRLKEMTWEYWDYHCGLIGYQVKKNPITPQASSKSVQQHGSFQPVVLGKSFSGAVSSNIPVRGTVTPVFQNSSKQGAVKRKEVDRPREHENLKRRAGPVADLTGDGKSQNFLDLSSIDLEDDEAVHLIQENKKLRAQFSECEKRQEELNEKVNRLRKELKEAQRAYAHLLVESRLLGKVKEENNLIL